MSETETNDGEDFEAFEAKMDELNEGLLTSFAAGFAHAKDVYNIEQGPDDYRSLMNTQGVSESHHYFWNGRTKPLEFWLREQFGLDEDIAEDMAELQSLEVTDDAAE